LQRHELWVSSPRSTRRAASTFARWCNGPWASRSCTHCAVHGRDVCDRDVWRPSPSLPPFLRASRQSSGSWLQVPRAGRGLHYRLPSARGRQTLSLVERDNKTLSVAVWPLALDCSSRRQLGQCQQQSFDVSKCDNNIITLPQSQSRFWPLTLASPLVPVLHAS
jgi:hypothetical protein